MRRMHLALRLLIHCHWHQHMVPPKGQEKWLTGEQVILLVLCNCCCSYPRWFVLGGQC